MTQGALCPIAGRASPLLRVWNVFVAAGYGFEFCDSSCRLVTNNWYLGFPNHQLLAICFPVSLHWKTTDFYQGKTRPQR
jgi:hypothetical protein